MLRQSTKSLKTRGQEVIFAALSRKVTATILQSMLAGGQIVDHSIYWWNLVYSWIREISLQKSCLLVLKMSLPP